MDVNLNSSSFLRLPYWNYTYGQVFLLFWKFNSYVKTCTYINSREATNFQLLQWEDVKRAAMVSYTQITSQLHVKGI
jgi:hypothetical protein